MKLSTRGIMSAALAVIVAIAMVAAPRIAVAADEEESLAELQQRVEDTTAAYEDACQRVEDVKASIAENEEKIKGIEAELPGKRARAAESLRTQYKMHQSSNSLLELLLSSESFYDMISTLEYLDHIQAHNNEAVTDLLDTQAKLQETRDVLAGEKSRAEVEAERADEARQEAVDVREEAQQRAFERAERERAEAEAAAKAARENEGKEFETASGQKAKVTVPDEVVPTKEQVAPQKEEPAQDEQKPQDETDSEDEAEPQQQAEPDPEPEPEEEEEPESVELPSDPGASDGWAGRIDAYLAGSPLAGYGSTFAQAALAYNVDPRWSPAIACIESGKGAVCFLPHNAWGWGSASWGSWEEAINAHVAGLASIYGYTISPSAAEMYCPGTAGEWYSAVLAEMNSI